LIGSETLLQLTHGASADSKPAWSPDGRNIAFLRASAGTRAWYVVSALGGAERKITDVFPYFDLGGGNSPYYAPDGKSLAIVDKGSPREPASIFLVSLGNSERRKLTSPPNGTTGDYYPAFSPDGKQLAFARAISFSATDLYVLPLQGQVPRRLTFDGLTIEGLTWTPDSREIVFSSRRGGSVNSLWRITANGGRPERVSTVGEDVVSPAVSAGSKRLAYTRVLDDMNIWSLTLDADGRETARAPLIASTFRDSDPDFSPDGEKIAFTSGRAGSFGIWVCNSDGTNPKVLFDGGPYVTGSPRWSPDGHWIAFDSRADNAANAGNPSIWIIGAEGGALRRLTPVAAGAAAPSWSHDGRSVYYASARSGNLEVWKIPAAGGAAVQVTRGGGFEAFESADGRYVYYLKGRAIPGIWRVPVGGGEEVPVTDRNQAGLWRSWRVAGHGLYYATAAPPLGPRLEFLDLASGEVREIDRTIKAPDVTIPSLAVSPDGRRLLYAQYDQSGSNILMVEGFR
jgi:Tol biopolymer transport system component